MGTLARYFKEYGIAEGKIEGMALGREEGKAEGKAEKSKTIAVNMLEKGFSVAIVAEVTELSLLEVEQLQKIEI